MHLFHLSSTLELAIDYWLQLMASSCFAVGDLASINFEPKTATVASAYAAFANAAVHLALAAFAAAYFDASTDHSVKTLAGLEATLGTSASLDSSSVIASYHQHDCSAPIIGSSLTSPSPY